VVAQISSQATTYVRIPVYADNGGVQVNPTSYAVNLAFIPVISNSAPLNTDWKTGSWTTTAQGGYVAQCLVGPSGGQITLTNGTTYNVWLQILANPETFVANTGQIQVTQ
jgi:hypothetical protein